MPNSATVFSPDGTISPTWLKDMMLQQQATVASPSPAIIPNTPVNNPAGAGVAAATQAPLGTSTSGTPSPEEIERHQQLAAAGDANSIDWLRTFGLLAAGGATIAGGVALSKALKGRGKKASEINMAAKTDTNKSMPITRENAKTPAELPNEKKAVVPHVTKVQEEPITYLPPQKLLPRGTKIPRVSPAMRAILALP